MKILYLTNESLEKQPIVNSQIIPLLEEIEQNSDYVFDLLVVDEKDFIERYKESGVSIVFLRKSNKLIQIFSFISFLLRNGNNYSIIHVRSYVPFLFLLPIKLFLRSKLIFDMRGVLPEEFIEQAGGFKGRLFYNFFKFFEPIFLKCSDRIVVVSNMFKEHILNNYTKISEGKIVVVSTFSRSIQLQNISIRQEMKISEHEKLFVYSGSLTKWQNFETIVDLFREINSQIGQSCLIVFTFDIEKAQNILKKSLPDGCYRVKFVPNNLLGTYLSQCDIGFLLRNDSLVNKVSAPIKLKDYLTAHVPIIISDGIGDSSEIIIKYGVGIVLEEMGSQKDLQDFAKQNCSCIKRLISAKDPNIYKELYKNELSIDISRDKYIQMYENLI